MTGWINRNTATRPNDICKTRLCTYLRNYSHSLNIFSESDGIYRKPVLCAYPSLLLNTSIAITSTTSLFQTCTAPHQVDYISSNMQSAEPWWGLFTCHLNIKHVLFTVMPRRSTSYSKLGTLSMKIWANSQINDISFPEVCIIWRTIW